jgi:hypothetical protein
MPKQTKLKRSATLDNVLEYYVKTLSNSDPNYNKFAVEGQLRNLRSQCSNDPEAIYDELEQSYPLYGYPLNLFEDCFEEEPLLAEQARKSAEKVRKEAAKVQVKAAAEFDNRLKCAELEQTKRNVEANTSELTTKAPEKRSEVDSSDSLLLTCGTFVSVKQDLSVGMCSYGGRGWVTEVSGEGETMIATVEYLKNEPGVSEANIPFQRISTINTPFTNDDSNKRRRVSVVTPPKATEPERQLSFKEALEDAHCRKRRKGWRAKDLGLAGATRTERRKVIVYDIIEFRGFRAYAASQLHTERGSTGKFVAAKRRKSMKASNSGLLTNQFLADAWNVSRQSLHEMMKLTPEELLLPKPLTASQKSVIQCREAAKSYYTPQRLYINHYIRTKKDEISELAYGQAALAAKCYIWGEEAKGLWICLGDGKRGIWEFKARNHDERQPQIRDQILDSLRRNPTKSFEKVAADIGYWCSCGAIFRWLTSYMKISMYVQRILPLLSSAQMYKHLAFARHLIGHWGLPRRKYLWIHYDEKWFWGLVARATAKYLEAILGKRELYAYHKSHINKVMAVAFTAYAFDGHIENGGHGIKLGFFRTQKCKIAAKQVRESRIDEATGGRKFDGKVVREKGAPYFVDCNVTGSDEGTASSPKFALMGLFKGTIFPMVSKLVGPGGRYEGYIPVFQGDNAGPHQDATFKRCVEDQCSEKGWKWEPQAPQMPHMNNLDLAVFPAMSKRHSDLLAEHGNTVAACDTIWEAAEKVWKGLDSPSIARGFVLAYRLAKRVVEYKGSNEFLCDKQFHCGVRKDYRNTADGIKKGVTPIDV